MAMLAVYLLSSFVPAVLAAMGEYAVIHGLEQVGPKYGATHHKILKAAGLKVNLTPEAATKIRANRLGFILIKANCNLFTQFNPDSPARLSVKYSLPLKHWLVPFGVLSKLIVWVAMYMRLIHRFMST